MCLRALGFFQKFKDTDIIQVYVGLYSLGGGGSFLTFHQRMISAKTVTKFIKWCISKIQGWNWIIKIKISKKWSFLVRRLCLMLDTPKSIFLTVEVTTFELQIKFSLKLHQNKSENAWKPLIKFPNAWMPFEIQMTTLWNFSQ